MAAPRDDQPVDDQLVRVRLLGGLLAPAQIEALATIAAEYGGATLQLTARSSVGLSGITDHAAVADAVVAAGLTTGDGGADIVASPLSGRVGHYGDIRGLVRELGAELQATPELAQLPSGFWFGLDDGRGDVAGLGADLGAALDGAGAQLLISGRTTGLRVDADDVVDALTGAAARFVDLRGNARRASELPDPAMLFDDAQLGGAVPPHTGPPIGWIEQDDGRVALGAAAPLNQLSAELAQFVAAIDRPVAITPWRTLVVFDLDEGAADVVLRVLAPMGLIFDAEHHEVSR